MGIGSTGPQAHSKVVEDIRRNTLEKVRSEFGKLVYLSSLRDANSGIYHHYGVEAVYSSEQADRAFRQIHLSLFYEWLQKPLAEQKEDLEHYFRTVEGELGMVLENWKVLEPYRAYVPAESDEPGRRLFVADLQLIVNLLLAGLSPPARPSIA